MAKVYAILVEHGQKYAAHIDRHAADRFQKFPSFHMQVSVISKKEYQELRAAGMPSWGEHQLQLAGMNFRLSGCRA